MVTKVRGLVANNYKDYDDLRARLAAGELKAGDQDINVLSPAGPSGYIVPIGSYVDNGGTIITSGAFAWIRTSGEGWKASWFLDDDEALLVDQTPAAQLMFTSASLYRARITFDVRALVNRADFGEFLDIEFSGSGEMKTTEITVRDVDGNIIYAGASLISSTAIKIKCVDQKHSGATPDNSSYFLYADSDAMTQVKLFGGEYVDSGHWIKGGANCVVREHDNGFKSSVYAQPARNSVVPFSKISVGTEDWAAEDEPRTRLGRLFSSFNEFDVWCDDGTNRDLAKYTGLCEAPQVVYNKYFNRNINSFAEVDMYTASYRGKVNNDHRNCNIKVQTNLGALSASTTSPPIAHFTRIGGSFKFDDQSIHTYAILARGGYFLISDYVIDAKKTTANVSFNAVHVRSADSTYYGDDSGTGSCVNYHVGAGLIDIRCDNYNGMVISPFNEFTSRLHYDYHGVTVLGGNSIVANGVSPGSLRDVSIYHADNYPVLSIKGLSLYSSDNLLLNSDGSKPNAILQDERSKGNFADTVASSVNPASLSANTLDIDQTSTDIDLVTGTGTINTIVGGFRGQRVTLRWVSGATTLVHNTSKIVLAGSANKVMNSANHVIELKKLSSNGVWFELGGTV